ncbi:Mor transcription activator family protein [Stenotrophomonas maltophilia]|uniref:Mor transcription activator family protein n=1 Tax=Stenotrophomonas maltophilia TaxID=40324 RepID=UPI00131108E0|nr:Mor transcription activator family protein [Stenotrophomonas maltophilia]
MVEQRDLIRMPEGEEAAALIQRGGIDLPESRWAAQLVALVQVMELAFQRSGADEELATRLALAGVLAQAEYAGGRMMYLPRGQRLRNALRDAEIYRRAKRGNIQELAREYGLTDVSVYRICREQKELHLSKVQSHFDFKEQG